MATTKKAKTEAAQQDAPLREGARFRDFKNGLDLPKTEVDAAATKAEEIARERGDRIVRDYYLYMALGRDMPESVKKRWEHFEATGKELTVAVPKSGNGSGKPKAAQARGKDTTKSSQKSKEPDGKSNGTSAEKQSYGN